MRRSWTTGAAAALALAIAGCSGGIVDTDDGAPGPVPGSSRPDAPAGGGSPAGMGTTSPGSGPTAGSPPATPATPAPPANTESGPCMAVISPVSAPAFDNLPAAAGSKLRVRAQLTGMQPGPATAWDWSIEYIALTATAQPEPVTVTAVGQPSTVEFPVERPGVYLIAVSVAAGAIRCEGTAGATAKPTDKLLSYFRVRATPPANLGLPVQESAIQVVGGTPVRQDLVLQRGETVSLAPSDEAGQSFLPAYVRLSHVGTTLTHEGHTGKAGERPFQAVLLPPVTYDLLIIPDADGKFAPVLHTGKTPSALAVLPQRLTAGTRIEGRVLDATGAPVRDARAILRAGALTSTVGYSDAAGAFTLLVREGRFEVVVSPPPGSGLPDAHVAAAPGVAVGATSGSMELRWNDVPRARLGLVIRTADGASAPGTRVKIELESPLPSVATLVARTNGTPATLQATGQFRASATAGAGGAVELPAVPRGRYRISVVPADADATAALTVATIDATAGDVTGRELRLARRAPVRGRLTAGAETGAVKLTALPVANDIVRPPVTVTVGSSGAYELPVDPGRRYLLVADPGPGRPFARSVIAAVEPDASGATVPDKALPRALLYSGIVTVDARLPSVGGAVIQLFCSPGSPGCYDGTVPIAETVSGPGGAFQLAVPDPGAPL